MVHKHTQIQKKEWKYLITLWTSCLMIYKYYNLLNICVYIQICLPKEEYNQLRGCKEKEQIKTNHVENVKGW